MGKGVLSGVHTSSVKTATRLKSVRAARARTLSGALGLTVPTRPDNLPIAYSPRLTGHLRSPESRDRRSVTIVTTPETSHVLCIRVAL